jgi:hypothetical protein
MEDGVLSEAFRHWSLCRACPDRNRLMIRCALRTLSSINIRRTVLQVRPKKSYTRPFICRPRSAYRTACHRLITDGRTQWKTSRQKRDLSPIKPGKRKLTGVFDIRLSTVSKRKNDVVLEQNQRRSFREAAMVRLVMEYLVCNLFEIDRFQTGWPRDSFLLRALINSHCQSFPPC